MVAGIVIALIKFIAGKLGYEMHLRGELEKAREAGKAEGKAEVIAEFAKQQEKVIIDDKHKPDIDELNDLYRSKK